MKRNIHFLDKMLDLLYMCTYMHVSLSVDDKTIIKSKLNSIHADFLFSKEFDLFFKEVVSFYTTENVEIIQIYFILH